MWWALAGALVGVAALWVAYELGCTRERLRQAKARAEAFERIRETMSTEPKADGEKTSNVVDDLIAGVGSKAEADRLLQEALEVWPDI